MTVPPGPRGAELIGFFGIRYAPHTLGFLEQTARRYGPFSYFRLLHQHLYLADDADLIKDVLVTRQSHFGRDLGAVILRELVGDGLITRDEPQHRERRRVLQPAFHRDQIASYVTTMAEETVRALQQWPAGMPLNMGQQMRKITLAIIGSTLFGPEFRDSAGAVSTILELVMKRTGKIAPFLSLLKPMARGYRRVLPRGPSLFFASERAALDRILSPLIERRRGSASRDVLSLLLHLQESEEQSFSDEAIRNEIVTFVLAGHETTATALTWACYLLAAHPDVQNRLREEAVGVFGNRAPTMDDLPRLTYAASVFNETVRLYPPVPVFGRRVMETIELGGYIVPAGASVLLSTYVTSRNPRYFVEPAVFQPDRWSCAEQPPKFAYFPFGGGAKMCIGDTFAKTEGTLILSLLASRFRLFSDSSEPIPIGPRATLQPARPVLLRPESFARR